MNIFTKIIGLLRRPILQTEHSYYSYRDDPAIKLASHAQWDAELVPLLRHRNGYVREAAVKRAGKLLLPNLVPYLMERINDWVPQVRVAAHGAVKSYISADRFDDILSALPIVYWLRECRRITHEQFIEHIEQFLVTHARKTEIPPRIAQLSDIYARSHFDLACKYGLADTKELINYGIQSSDWPTLRKACRMIDQLPVAEQFSYGKVLLKKKTGWLRVEGLRLVSLNNMEAGKEFAQQYLLSSYAPLRELAERLSGLTAAELSDLRRKALSDAQNSTQVLVVAIWLSGSLRDKTAEVLVENFKDHQNPKLRGTALLALTRLSPQKFSPLVISALDDTNSAVAREAAKAFKEMNLFMTPSEWVARTKSGITESHFRRIVGLARMKNKWDHLGVLLEYGASERFTQAVTQELQIWRWQFNRSPAPPTSAQHAWISTNLASYKGESPSAADLAFYCR